MSSGPGASHLPRGFSRNEIRASFYHRVGKHAQAVSEFQDFQPNSHGPRDLGRGSWFVPLDGTNRVVLGTGGISSGWYESMLHRCSCVRESGLCVTVDISHHGAYKGEGVVGKIDRVSAFPPIVNCGHPQCFAETSFGGNLVQRVDCK